MVRQLIAYPLTFLVALWAGSIAEFFCTWACLKLTGKVHGLLVAFLASVLNGGVAAAVAFSVFWYLKLSPVWLLILLVLAVTWNDKRRIQTRPAMFSVLCGDEVGQRAHRLQVLHLAGDLTGLAAAWVLLWSASAG